MKLHATELQIFAKSKPCLSDLFEITWKSMPDYTKMPLTCLNSKFLAAHTIKHIIITRIVDSIFNKNV